MPTRSASVLLEFGLLALGFGFVAGGLAFAQSNLLPATAPTRVPDTLPTAVPASAAFTPAERASHRAVVVYSGGRLEVTADNSSLNQILREVARQTGMKITGGVSEERVFGKYGPASPAEVLDSLLDGTDTNILLRQSAEDAPAELVLTRRGGGPTPPNPNALGYDDEPAPPPAPSAALPPVQQTSQQPQLPFSRPVSTPPLTDIMQTPQTPAPGGIVGAPTVAPATEPGTTPGPTTQSTGTSDTTSGTTDATSPNGVKTPEQIYLELQQLRQQQQQPPAPQ
jgi:hypothetical protein